jgi:hypothetical protein
MSPALSNLFALSLMASRVASSSEWPDAGKTDSPIATSTKQNDLHISIVPPVAEDGILVVNHCGRDIDPTRYEIIRRMARHIILEERTATGPLGQIALLALQESSGVRLRGNPMTIQGRQHAFKSRVLPQNSTRTAGFHQTRADRRAPNQGIALVVTLNVSLTPPIVSVALSVFPLRPAEVRRTVTMSPLFTRPSTAVCTPPFTEYSPP